MKLHPVFYYSFVSVLLVTGIWIFLIQQTSRTRTVSNSCYADRKGINFLTSLYSSQDIAIPVGYQLITKTEYYVNEKTGKTNHFFAALWGYVKLEVLKLNSKLNHCALKSKLYIKALQQSYLEWQSLKSF